MTLGLPGISITFKKIATDPFAASASVGIVGMILDDASVVDMEVASIETLAQIPSTLSVENQDYIKMALKGKPKELKVITLPSAGEMETLDITPALTYLEVNKVNIVVAPGQGTTYQTQISDWVKVLRDSHIKRVSAVVSNTAGDHEGVWNFTTKNIETKDGTYSANQYIARIAGLIAGLDLGVSPTFQVLEEVISIPTATKTEIDASIEAGELVLYHDGDKAKIARGVTSLKTIAEGKSLGWRKIKLTRIYDKIYQDIKGAMEDNYIGKVGNSYPNKILLIEAINTYLKGKEDSGLLHPGKNNCEMDLEAQKDYLASIGYLTDDGRNVVNMTEQEIKEAETDDKGFYNIIARGVDAMEDVDINIYV